MRDYVHNCKGPMLFFYWPKENQKSDILVWFGSDTTQLSFKVDRFYALDFWPVPIRKYLFLELLLELTVKLLGLVQLGGFLNISSTHVQRVKESILKIHVQLGPQKVSLFDNRVFCRCHYLWWGYIGSMWVLNAMSFGVFVMNSTLQALVLKVMRVLHNLLSSNKFT